MQPEHESLRELNVDMGAAEARGDERFFEDLLAPAFAMRRASGKIVDRKEFVDALEESGARATEVESITQFERNRALVACIVTMDTPEGSKRFHNLRLFTRESDSGDWKLLAWANEPR